MLRVSTAIGGLRKITVTQIYRSFLICNFSVDRPLSCIILKNVVITLQICFTLNHFIL